MGFNVLWSLSQILNNSILEYVFCKGKLMGKGRTRQGAEAQAYTQSTLSHLPELGSQGPIPPPSRAPRSCLAATSLSHGRNLDTNRLEG